MFTSETILLTGGSGILGTEIKKLLPNIIAPSYDELDVTDFEQCKSVIEKYNPDIIIHAAAFTDVSGAEINREKCWAVNVNGTENIIQASRLNLEKMYEVQPHTSRFVYISTDYVFDGTKGNYKEDDIPNPKNYYSLTKLLGEVIIRQYPNTLTIRTAFKPKGPWLYPKAFVDQYSSHELVDRIAPEIVQAVLMSELLGTIHIAGDRKRMYDLAKQVSPEVGEMYRKDVAVQIPEDTSLNTNKWKEIFSKLKSPKK